MYQKAFLFNGIGSKPKRLLAKMTKDMVEKFKQYQLEAFSLVNLNADIEKNYPEDKLIAKWITSSVCDKVVFEKFIENKIFPDIGAGYSSGIVSICAAFSVFTYEFAYKIIMSNKSTMNALKANNKNLDMGVIIGLDVDFVRELISKFHFENKVFIGSINSKVYTLITGEADSVALVLKAASDEGAMKSIKMNVGISYHCPLIAPYCCEYNSFCATGKYNDPDYPIISAYDHRIMTSADDLKQENCINVPSPLRWDLTFHRLEEIGITEFFDMSADCTIKRFSRCECKSTKIFAHTDI